MTPTPWKPFGLHNYVPMIYLWNEVWKGTSGCRKRRSAKGVRSLFFVFGTLSVTFWSLFLMLLSLSSSLFCQTPFAGLLLRQGAETSSISLPLSGAPVVQSYWVWRIHGNYEELRKPQKWLGLSLENPEKKSEKGFSGASRPWGWKSSKTFFSDIFRGFLGRGLFDPCRRPTMSQMTKTTGIRGVNHRFPKQRV